MKKSVLALTLLVGAMSCQAGILDKLKTEPASKYELGKFQLQLMAYILNQKLKSPEKQKGEFKIKNFRIDEKDGKLFFIVSSVGPAKELTDEACTTFNETILQQPLFKSLPRKTWPNLSDKEYKQLESELIVATELVSKENASFKIQCS